MKMTTKYTCPMHPEVVRDAPGKCPTCGMNLVPVKEEASAHSEHQNHLHQAEEVSGEHHTVYYCPMKCEGEKTYLEPGSCPVCGMHLVPVGKEPAASIKPAPMPLVKRRVSAQTHQAFVQPEGEY